jgi:hypothetical protein
MHNVCVCVCVTPTDNFYMNWPAFINIIRKIMLCETVNVTKPIYSIFSAMATQTSEVCVAVAPSVYNILIAFMTVGL